MSVDDGVHQRAREEEALGRGDVPLREHEVRVASRAVHVSRPVDAAGTVEPEFADEPTVVDGAVGDAGVVGVAHEVVHPVHVEFTGNELSHAALAPHEVRDALRVEPVAFQRGTDLPLGVGQEPFDLVVVPAGRAPDDALGLVAVRTVAGVMEERGRADVRGGVVVHRQVVERLRGEVVDAQAVLETGVVRGGKDEPDGGELLDVPEPLERGRVDEVRGDRVERDVVVDAVLDRLHYRTLGASGDGRFGSAGGTS